MTSHPAEERHAFFSPDGSMLAFDSDRDGGRNLYVMRVSRAGGMVTTGAVKRVTISDRAEELSGWSSDGKWLLFYERSPGIYRGTKMFKAPVSGGTMVAITPAYGQNPHESADGAEVIFTRRRPDLTRPNYKGSAATDVWSMNTRSGQFRQVTSNEKWDAEGQYLPDGSVVYISTRDGQNNVWKIKAGGDDAAAVQLTQFKPAAGEMSIGHGVRDLAVSQSGSTAAFCVWDTLYTLDLRVPGGEPKAVNITVAIDLNEVDQQRTNFGREVSEQALSPDGKTIAMVARGEVYVRSTDENRPTRRVTATAGREQGIAWSPDGRVLWFVSDEGGHNELCYAMVTLAKEDLTPKEEKKDEEKADEKKDDAKKDEGEKKDDPAVKKDEPKKDEPAGDKKDDKAAADAKPKEKKPAGPDYAKRWAEALRFEVKKYDASIIPPGKNDGVLGMEVTNPVPSPDGRQLLVTRGLGDLLLIDLVEKTCRVVFEGWNEPEVRWAADSQHIVFVREDLDFNADIFLLDLQADKYGKQPEPINLTRHPDTDRAPRLSRDGKVLYFLSERGLENDRFAVYWMYLDQKLETMTAYDLEEYFKKQGTAAKALKPIAAVVWDDAAWLEKDAKEKEKEKEKAKPAGGAAKPLVFDTTNSHLRIRRIAGSLASLSDLVATPAGDRVLFSEPPMTPGPGTESSLVSVSYKGDDRKPVTTGSLGRLEVSLTGERITFVKGKQAAGTTIAGGKVDTYTIDAPVVLDVKAQQRQKFLDAARIIGNQFYHPTLKGLNWQAMSDRYITLAEKARTTGEFNRVFNLMLGELDGSHMGISGGPGTFSPPALGVGCLGVDVEPVANGWKISKVLFNAPVSKDAHPLVVGDVITEVDGKPTAGKEWPEVMVNTAGREILVTVRRLQPVGAPVAPPTPAEPGSGKPEGERKPIGPAEVKPQVMLLTAISRGEEDELRYQDEVQARAAQVDRLSGGKLGYLHIRAMSEASVVDYERDLFAAANGKAGLIIDVRDNGGGSTADILLSSLTAPRHAYTVPRGADAKTVPQDSYPRDRRLIYGYTRPINVLINENSYSNAEIFAHSIKTIGRGKLIGTATYGAVISTGAAGLVDGANVRTPFRGWYLPDGTDMEHHGAQPDVNVVQSPADDAAGRDVQLEAAVKELLERAGK